MYVFLEVYTCIYIYIYIYAGNEDKLNLLWNRFQELDAILQQVES